MREVTGIKEDGDRERERITMRERDEGRERGE